MDTSLVVVLVPVHWKASPRAAYASWYPYAESRAFFVGRCANCSYALAGADEDSGLTIKVRAMLLDALARFPRAKFFMKTDLDTYLVPECLFDFLSRLDPDEPLLTGFHMFREYVHGGAGYVVTRAALERTANMTAPLCSLELAAANYSSKATAAHEDRWLTACLASTGARVRHSDRFFPVSLVVAHESTPPWYEREVRFVRDELAVAPPYVPEHGLVSLHQYRSPHHDYMAVHAALRLVRVP